MAQYTATRLIAAPIDQVFETVAHVENFEKALPHITSVEFLTPTHTGVGARFRETRVMRGRPSTTELEVTEYVANERIRLIADEGGTVWDTVFSVRENAEHTELSMVMDAQPYRLTARVINPLISGMVGKAVEADMDAVKDYCETAAG